MREQFDNYEKRIMERLDQEAEEIRRAIKNNPEVAAIQGDERLDEKVYAAIDAFEEAVAERKRSALSGKNGEADRADTEDADVLPYAGRSEKDADALPYAGLSEKDMEALRLGWEVQERRKEEESRREAENRQGTESGNAAKRRFAGWKSGWKRVAAALLVFALVGGIGVTSVGGPKQVVKYAKLVVGDRELSKVNSSSKDAKPVDENAEMEAYQRIEDELGIDSVRVVKIPGKMKYKYCEIDTEVRTAQLLYEYGGKNISYLISDSYGEELWITDIEDSDANKYPYIQGELQADIMEHELPEGKGKKYTVEFEYRDVHYQLTGVMERQEFEEILKNLHFPT